MKNKNEILKMYEFQIENFLEELSENEVFEVCKLFNINEYSYQLEFGQNYMPYLISDLFMEIINQKKLKK